MPSSSKTGNTMYRGLEVFETQFSFFHNVLFIYLFIFIVKKIDFRADDFPISSQDTIPTSTGISKRTISTIG